MTKASITPLGLALLLGTASILSAQSPSGLDTAVQHGLQLQAAQISLRQTLQEAREAEMRKDLPAAAKLYDAAWDLVVKIGKPGPEAQQTVAGLTAVRMELARQAQRRGDLADAETHVLDVLRVNPRNEEALEFERTNKKLLDQQRGMRPSPEVYEQIPNIQDRKIKAATLTQDGRLLYEMGEMNQAEAELKKAMALDPGNEGAVYYLSLVQQALDKRAAQKKNVMGQELLVQVETAWEDSLKRDTLPIPNPVVASTLIYTGKGRQGILNKLDRIRIETVFFDNLPLSEVVRVLSEEAKKRDPERKGINFLINPQQAVAIAPPTGIGGGGGVPGFPGIPAAPVQLTDPATGLPLPAAPPAEGVDINTVTVRINPALNDVRMADVLDAIIKVADHSIKYSLEDYAVVFSLKGQETTPLFVRRFKVDPNTFVQGLESVGGFVLNVATTQGGGGGGGVGGGGGGQAGGQGGQGAAAPIPRVNVAGGAAIGGGGVGGQGGQGGGGGGGGGVKFVTSTNNVDAQSTGVMNFFRALGVDLNPALGKSVFFNDREGSLLVRATADDLDIIEAAIQVLNIAPPQLTIKAKFVEIAQNDTRALGLDWYLGNFLMNNNGIGMQAGTAPTFAGTPTTANPLGTFPGSVTVIPDGSGTINNTTIPSAPSDQLLTAGLRQLSALNPSLPATPALATLTGILTDPQFRVVLRALEQRDGADLLTEGQVTTLSGRQAQMQVVDLRTIVTGTGANGGQQAAAPATGVGTTVQTPQTFIQPTTTPVALGPTLDVIPYVSADGFTIQMTIIPTIIEFVGYDDPGAFVVQAQNGNGLPLTAQLPLPRFRIRQVTTSAIVWDGQTVVLGGLISENVVRVKDKVPVLGDLPFVGRLFRSESKATAKKNLVIFVTPTIIDPSGNRTHIDEDLPFAQSAVPTQNQRPVPNP